MIRPRIDSRGDLHRSQIRVVAEKDAQWAFCRSHLAQMHDDEIDVLAEGRSRDRALADLYKRPAPPSAE